MPLHLEAIMPEAPDADLLSELLSGCLDPPDAVLQSPDGRILHPAAWMRDAASGQRVGKFVFTFAQDPEDRSLDLLDADITLDGGDMTPLRFLRKLPGSSDANEYYDVEAEAEGQRLQIETVNRGAAAKAELTDEALEVRACAFPFRLEVYPDLAAFHASFTGSDVQFSETFAAPGSLTWGAPEEGEAFSILLGTVERFRDVTVRFGSRCLSFTVILARTALGLLPVAASRAVFDGLDTLAPGNVLFLYANIKADLAPAQ